MAEFLDEKTQLESTTVGVFRTAATVKGGRRFSFSSLVVAGNRRGDVGIGYGKANQVPPAIEKAQKEARKSMQRIQLHEGTIPHEVLGRFGSAKVKLVPASPGTGVVAGASVRAVLEMTGITDCLTKCYGSTNKQNVVKATINALKLLRTREEIEALRGVKIGKTEVDERLERASGSAAIPSAAGPSEAADDASSKDENTPSSPDKK
jgi:small subunit ribosomal protein S5